MKKYEHPLTAKLTPDNWKEQLNLDALSQNDLSTLLGDLKAMEAFGKKVGGFVKEVVKGRMPKGEDEFDGSVFHIQRNHRVRAGGLDRDRILENMGEEWVEEYSKDDTEYDEIRVTRKEK